MTKENERASMVAQSRRAWVGALIAASIVVLFDQITKSWAQSQLRDEPMHVFGSLYFALTYNRGVAFGLGEGIAPGMIIAVMIIGVLFLLPKKRVFLSTYAILGVGLMLGGAIGNIIDRLFRDTGGAVVDFIDVGWWPVFNVADSAVVIGAVLLVLWGSRQSSIEASK